MYESQPNYKNFYGLFDNGLKITFIHLLESDSSEDDEFNQKVKDEKERIGNDNNENTKTGFWVKVSF